MQDYDVVIVGAGPGGLTAGLYASRATLKTVCIEKMSCPAGRSPIPSGLRIIPASNLSAAPNWLAKWRTTPRNLASKSSATTSIEIYSDGPYRIVKGEYDEYRGKTVIVATGGQPRKLGVPGELELAGRGVSYCAICDGSFFKGVPIAVSGGGDSAVEEGMFLTKFGSKVYISSPPR